MNCRFEKDYTLKVNKLIYLLFVIPLIHIEGLAFIMPSIYFLLFRVFTILDFVIISSLFIFVLSKNVKINKFVLITIAISFINIVMTLINNGDLINVIGIWTFVLPILFLFSIFKNDICTLLEVIYRYLFTVIIINFILMLYLPNGLYPEGIQMGLGKIWLLGYKSSLQNFVLPLVMIAYLRTLYTHRYCTFIFIMLLAHFECYFSSNSMFLMGLVLCDFMVGFRLVDRIELTKKLFLLMTLGIVCFNFVLVIYTKDFLDMPIVKWLIMDVLGKDITLSMRTTAWIATIDEIIKNPILGQGYTSLEYRTLIFNRPTAHAHNIFLEVLYEGGLIAISLFGYLMYSVMCKIYSCRKLTSARCIYWFIIIIFIMFSFENILQKSCGLLWGIFLIGMFVDTIDFNYRRLILRKVA